tara:strand:- start:2329 stop:2790 length:462 start_codon:yes stop_codon:yes gene_type:complete
MMTVMNGTLEPDDWGLFVDVEKEDSLRDLTLSSMTKSFNNTPYIRQRYGFPEHILFSYSLTSPVVTYTDEWASSWSSFNVDPPSLVPSIDTLEDIERGFYGKDKNSGYSSLDTIDWLRWIVNTVKWSSDNPTNTRVCLALVTIGFYAGVLFIV